MSNLDLFKTFAPKDKTIRVSGENVVIYTRVSDVSQKDNTSLGSQKLSCEKYAEQNNLKVLEYFGGTYESAKTDDREQFTKMLTFVKRNKKKINCIVVYSYERFSRTGIDGAQIAQELQYKHGVKVVSVTQPIDESSPFGMFMQNFWFLNGHVDNVLRRGKTIEGMQRRLRAGYTPHNPPRGFSNLSKGTADQHDIVVNEEGKLIRKAFQWKANKNLTNVEIAKRLKALGLDLNVKRLTEIFSNPYYCGLITHSLIPDEVHEGKHETLIDRKTFLKVNNIRAEIAKNRKHPKTHKAIDENLPLKRFLVCGDCDTPMTGYLVKAKGLYYYKCRTKGCKHNVSAKKLHEQFVSLLSMFEVDKTDVPMITEFLKTYYNAFFEDKKEDNKLVAKKITDIKKSLEKVEERYAIGDIDKPLYQKFSSKYKSQIDEIETKNIGKLNKSSNLEKCLIRVLEICSKPSLLWENRTIDEQLQLQNIVFPEGITVSRKKKIVRTTRINSLFAPVAAISKVLAKNKSGQPIDFDQLSALVTSAGFKPATA